MFMLKAENKTRPNFQLTIIEVLCFDVQKLV